MRPYEISPEPGRWDARKTQQGSEVAEQFVVESPELPVHSYIRTLAAFKCALVPCTRGGQPKAGHGSDSSKPQLFDIHIAPKLQAIICSHSVCDRRALTPVRLIPKAVVRGKGLPTTHSAWTPVPPADHCAFISTLGRGRENGEEERIPGHQSRGCIPKRAGRCSSTSLEDKAMQWAFAFVQAETLIRVVFKIQRCTLTACMNRAEGKGDCKE